MPVPMPTSDTRWRCAQCGNLTRFDVVRTVRSREFVHLDLAGEPSVDEREVLAETVEEVRCRWCRSEQVDLVPRLGQSDAVADADAPPAAPPAG